MNIISAENNKGVKMAFNLSKSRYCTAVQCPKQLWLKINKPEAWEECSDSQIWKDSGSRIGDLAMSLFGDFTEVAYDNDKSKMLCQTRALIAQGTAVIAEASFACNGLFCSVDILKKSGDGYEIYEVKSTTGNADKDIKKAHLDDVAYQNYVLTQCGIGVDRVCIVYVNNEYNYSGELDIQQLFKIEDITGIVREKMPEVEANPYACGFWKYCTRHLPQPNIFDLSGVGFDIRKVMKFYKEGIVSFEDLQKYDIPGKQRMMIEHQLNDLEPYVDKDNIRSFLNGLSYPLYFLDFESVRYTLPQYIDSRPYEQIPFQYSLHFIESAGAEAQHKEYLAYPGADPRRDIAEALCRDIPKNACIIAYNTRFEKERIKRLAGLYPDLSEHLNNMLDHIMDLMVPFAKKYYYTKAMQKSCSIKVVLPALFPDDPTLNYHNLEGVQNGGEASNAFVRMAEMSPEELEVSRKQLLEYCKLDTWAMVKIWEKLTEIVAENN